MLFLILFGTLITSIIVRGWVLSTLWAWFLVPIGAPEIGIATALGISVIIGLFTSHLNQETVKTSTKSLPDLFATILTKSLGAPLVSLCVGWIILQFA